MIKTSAVTKELSEVVTPELMIELDDLHSKTILGLISEKEVSESDPDYINKL